MLADYGWSDGQFSCLNSLWTKESSWDYTATNAGSGAYGIPQSLPASKMASVGADYRTNPVTQITWGLQYINRRTAARARPGRTARPSTGTEPHPGEHPLVATFRRVSGAVTARPPGEK